MRGGVEGAPPRVVISAPPSLISSRHPSLLPPATQVKFTAAVLARATAEVQAWTATASLAAGMHHRTLPAACRKDGGNDFIMISNLALQPFWRKPPFRSSAACARCAAHHWTIGPNQQRPLGLARIVITCDRTRAWAGAANATKTARSRAWQRGAMVSGTVEGSRRHSSRRRRDGVNPMIIMEHGGWAVLGTRPECAAGPPLLQPAKLLYLAAAKKGLL